MCVKKDCVRKIVCERCCVSEQTGGGGGGGGGGAGWYRIKNKNPTQRCGETSWMTGHIRGKFRSQTSGNMDCGLMEKQMWKEPEKRREEKRREDQRREKSQRKEDAGTRKGFSNDLWLRRVEK